MDGTPVRNMGGKHMIDDAALDNLIAEHLMGWKRHEVFYESCFGGEIMRCRVCQRTFCVPPHMLDNIRQRGWCSPHEYEDTPPPFSTSMSASRLVEDEIDERGLWKEYTTELLFITTGYKRVGTLIVSREGWSVIRATPRQRCLAACEVLGPEVSA